MSDKKVLMELTKDYLDTGLRGVPVGTCPTSMVDPILGLHYRGYPIKDLAYRDPEAVIYLLLHGELPSSSELKYFKSKIISRSKLNPKVIEMLKNLPSQKNPMKSFMIGILSIGMLSGKNDFKEDYLNLVAQLPEMVAALIRIRCGWGEPIASQPELGYMENFAAMLNPPNSNEYLVDLMRIFNVLHFDHGGGNLSTFVGKAIASGHADMFESINGSMAGLAGPLHGKANQECLQFLQDMQKQIKNPQDEKEIHEFIKDFFESGGKIFGFGHAVLRVEDPRATVQYDLGKKIAKDNKLFQLALTLRKIGSEFLGQQKKISNPFPNVDAVSGVLLNSVGINKPDVYTVLFGLSRCVGIATQILWERTEARGGKGIPITRPKYIYVGPKR